MPIYLRQRTSGHIYIFTPSLALRRDMEPYDPEVAKKRIDALLKRKNDLDAMTQASMDIPKDQLAEVTKDSRLIAELEAEIEVKESAIRDHAISVDSENDMQVQTEAQPPVNPPADLETILARERQDRIDEDPEVRKIRLMTDKATLQQYSLINFGVEVPDGKLKDMKKAVVEKRTEIIFVEKG